MEMLYLLGLAFLAHIVIAPIVAVVRASDARRRAKELEAGVADLRLLIAKLRNDREGAKRPEPREAIPTPPPEASPPQAPVPPVVAPPAPQQTWEPLWKPQPLTPATELPPPLPPKVESPPLKAPAPEPQKPAAPSPPVAKPALSLEQFLGVKLFAWVGGLALFLGIVFFVKYAFERNLISPALRTTIGYVIGVGLVGTGIRLRRSETYQVLAQTLAATGVLILYGVTYAAHVLYRFPAFGTVSTFAYMSFITAAAFLLAVRMNGQVIAVLGMAGGFLTPYLVNTGEDNPLGLFGYVLLLDMGLMLVARFRRWTYLVLCAAAGTVLMQSGWFASFFETGSYATGARIWIPIAIHLLFPALFATATLWLQRSEPFSIKPALGGLATAAWSVIVAFSFLLHPEVASRPIILNGFLFAINGLVLWQIWLQPRVGPAQWLMALATFVHLAWWSHDRLSQDFLWVALLSYLLFGVMHTGFALLAPRRHPELAGTQDFGVWMGPVATLLMMIPLLSLPGVPWLVWPAILLLNGMTVVMSAVVNRVPPILASLGVTLLGLAIWLFRLPTDGNGIVAMLLTLGLFSAVFAAAGLALSRRLGEGRSQNVAIASAALPFILLILACVRIPLSDPSPIFGLGLLLAVFLLYLAKRGKAPSLALVALACMAVLETTWYQVTPDIAPVVSIVWFIGTAAVFALYPFLLRQHFLDVSGPWKVSALAWVIFFPLVYYTVEDRYLEGWMGLVPALFALPSLAAFAAVFRQTGADESVRRTQLAWYAGVALFFITLIFPIQFERQWLTIGWALEGAALCWLYTRVPHEGLRRLGFGLLTASFVRLALNPSVFAYQVRSETPIWNWFLYAYGIVALAQFAAAWWLAPPRDRLGAINIRAVAWGFGTVLLFLLLNIEIADFFTPPGQTFLAFEFGGNFARSMTYSISWALFALALMVIGFWFRAAPARYAGIGLMGATLLKLFFNDLANIGSIYRISALVVVAVVALGASYLYQRFYREVDEGRF